MLRKGVSKNDFSIKIAAVTLVLFMLAQLTALYFALQNQRRTQFSDALEKEAVYYVSSLDKTVEKLKSIAMTVALDTDVILALNEREYDNTAGNRVSTLLSRYKQINFEVHRIMFCDFRNDYLVSNEKVYTNPDLFPLGNTYDRFKGKPVERVGYTYLRDTTEAKIQSFSANTKEVLRLIYFLDINGDNAVIIDMEADYVDDIFNDSDGDNHRVIEIVNDSGECVYKNNGELLNEKQYIDISRRVEELKSTVTIHVPMSEMSEWTSTNASIMLIYLCMFLVGLFLVLGIYSSKYIYRAYKVNKSEMKLIREKMEHQNLLSEKRELVACLDSPDNKQLSMAKKYLTGYKDENGRCFDIDNLVLLRIEIFNEKEYKEKYNVKDARLFRYGIVNICQECISEVCAVEKVTETENYIVFVASNPGENEIRKIAEKCSKSVWRYIHEDLSFFVSQSGNLEKLENCFVETVELAERQFFEDRPVVLFAKDLTDNEDLGDMGEEDFVLRWFEHFTNANSDLDNAELMSVLSGLSVIYAKKLLLLIFLEINFYVKNLEKEGVEINFDFGKGIYDFYNSIFLSQCIEELEQLKDKITKVSETTSKEYCVITKQIMRIVEERFKESYLSSASIADELGFATSYISRKFRDDMGMSVSSYINDARLSEAARLLVNTTKSIKEIFEYVGGTSYSYLFVQFKKKFGCTPAEYRAKFNIY